jgi:hypothetical protein
VKRERQGTLAQELDGALAFTQDPGRDETLSRYGTAGRKTGELLEVYRHILGAKRILEAASVRQASYQRELAAFEIGWDTAAASGLLTLLALARGCTLTSAVATTHAASVAPSALGRP